MTLMRILLPIAFGACAYAVELAATVVRVADGDTLTAALADGSELKVRLLYLDTPESKGNSHGVAMPEGKLAAEYLDLQAKAGSAITLWGPGDTLEMDRYKRALAVIITSRGDTLQERVIAAGWSPLWEKYGKADPKWRDTLQVAEDKAKQSKAGAWATAPQYMTDKSNETTAPREKD
jgi:endonuclease YncB( thermonuclease family)